MTLESRPGFGRDSWGSARCKARRTWPHHPAGGVSDTNPGRPSQPLEADAPEDLAAPVYARGYLRAYARYLGLDPEPLVEMLHQRPSDPRGALGIRNVARRPRFVITAPAAAGAGLLILAAAFALYAWRQIEADQRPSAQPPTVQLATVSPPTTPIPSPSPQARPMVVGIRVTDLVWINVTVDGKPHYSDAGRMVQAGSVVYFTGVDVKITSGRAAATFITIDGHAIGALGAGVATREFSSQTSP